MGSGVRSAGKWFGTWQLLPCTAVKDQELCHSPWRIQVGVNAHGESARSRQLLPDRQQIRV